MTRLAKSRARLFLRRCNGSFAEILTVAHEDVEGVEHDLIVMLAGVQSVEIRDAVNTEQHSLAVDDERTIRWRNAASVMSGNRPLQSWPLRVNRRTRCPSLWTISR